MLSDIVRKPSPEPPMITIVGTPGVGKTTLGAMFPNPIFIQAEEAGTVFEAWDSNVQPSVMPVLPRANIKKKVSTKQAMIEQLKMLGTEEHDFKTVIIDSVTSLHALLEHELCDIYNVDNVADAAGGFHKGYIAVSEMHGDIKDVLVRLRKHKKMGIVFLAHCGVKKIKNRPDAEEYTVYTLDMHEGSIKHYVNLVDAVVYIKNQEFVSGGQKDKRGNVTKFGRIIQTGERKIITSSDGVMGYVNAKNRYSMPVELDLPQHSNPLLEYIPYYGVSNGNKQEHEE